MVNISNVNSQQLLASTLSTTKLNLKAGQSLLITVNQVKGDQAQITIGKQTLVANHKMDTLTPGTLEVKVKQTQPSLVLEVPRPQTSASSPQNLMQQSILQKNYSQLMNQQQPVGQSLKQMLQLPGLSQTIHAWLQQITERLLKPNTLSGKELKNQIGNSGLFLENKLSQPGSASGNLKHDTKAQLLQLQKAIQSELKQKPDSTSLQQAGSLVAKALNKLTVQQLQLFENPLHLNLELPFEPKSPIDAFRIGLFKQQQSNRSTWECLLEVNIDEDCALFKLNLDTQDNELNLLAWSDASALNDTLESQLDQLAKQLDALGFHKVSVAMSPTKPQPARFATQVALVDIKV